MKVFIVVNIITTINAFFETGVEPVTAGNTKDYYSPMLYQLSYSKWHPTIVTNNCWVPPLRIELRITSLQVRRLTIWP
jgi:hypothetical protein